MLQSGESVLDQVSISIKTPIQILVASHGVTLSRDHDLGPLALNLSSYFLAVIALIRNNRFSGGEFGNQAGGLGAVVDLPSRDFKLDG